MKIRLVFAWYDFYIGGYWDRHKHILYLMVPFVGVATRFGRKQSLNIRYLDAKRSIITHACRTNRGISGAFDEAVENARREYEIIVGNALRSGRETELRLHLVLQVERSEKVSNRE